MYTDLAEYIIKSLVDNPDSVSVSETVRPNSVLIEVSVDSDDMGRIIGKRGRVINAIRTVMEVQAGRQDKHISVEIL